MQEEANENNQAPSQSTRAALGILFLGMAGAILYYAFVYTSTGSTNCYFRSLLWSSYSLHPFSAALFNSMFAGLCHWFDTDLESSTKTLVGTSGLVGIAILFVFLAMQKFNSITVQTFTPLEEKDMSLPEGPEIPPETAPQEPAPQTQDWSEMENKRDNKADNPFFKE